MNALLTYFHQALEELHHVRWPTRHQAVRLSIIVLVFIAVNAVLFGLVDFGLAKLVEILLSFTS